jgi:hypothetical protein
VISKSGPAERRSEVALVLAISNSLNIHIDLGKSQQFIRACSESKVDLSDFVSVSASLLILLPKYNSAKEIE